MQPTTDFTLMLRHLCKRVGEIDLFGIHFMDNVSANARTHQAGSSSAGWHFGYYLVLVNKCKVCCHRRQTPLWEMLYVLPLKMYRP